MQNPSNTKTVDQECGAFNQARQEKETLKQSQSRMQEFNSGLLHVSHPGEMASAPAHELNQSLVAISNYIHGSQRLSAESQDPNAAKIKTALDKAAEQAIRAGQIIRRPRAFVVRGDSEKQIERISKMIEEASALGLVDASKRGIALQLNLDPIFDLVLADRVQIQRALVNLLRNAVEAMAEAPKKSLWLPIERSPMI